MVSLTPPTRYRLVNSRLGRMSCDGVQRLATELCEGVAAAHSEGVLHLDLKPANVLVDREGRLSEDWSAKHFLVPFAEQPQLLRDDHVFNSNDPYWLPNATTTLTGDFSILHGAPAREADAQ